MDINNKLYEKQGIHVITSIFTVDKGETKVLLIKRKNEPFKNKWALVGGALYNNENLTNGAFREIYEKTGIKDIKIYSSNTFGDINRSPIMRMVAISYIGLVDSSKISFLKETLKTSDARFFSINEIPELAYDHKHILEEGIKTLKEKIFSTDILKVLFPFGFTIPEIHKVYETIYKLKIDRRNFRKKILSSDLIYDTDKYMNFEGKKPAKVYAFKDIINKNIL